MSRWNSPLSIQLHGPCLWITTAPLSYTSECLPGDITVPAEFITDLASVPRRPFAYLLAGGRAPAPAVLHDYLYQHPAWNDRRLADEILFEAMGVEDSKLGHYKEKYIYRWLIWAAVRIAGRHAFSHHKQRGAELNPIWTIQGWQEAP